MIEREIRSAQFTREWRAVQDLDGRIIVTFTPKQRAAREAAVAEDWERIRQAEEAEKAPAGELSAVASFW